jgi:hypothetical protein
MKRIIILFAFVLIASGLSAQSADINHLFSSYSGEKDVVSLYIPGFLCRIGAAIGDLDAPERDLLNSIRSVRILVSDNEELNHHVNFAKEVNYRNHKSDYQLLLEVHDSDNDVLIMGKERNGLVSELLIVVGGHDNAVICIKGRMDKDLLDALYEVTGFEECRYAKEI